LYNFHVFYNGFYLKEIKTFYVVLINLCAFITNNLFLLMNALLLTNEAQVRTRTPPLEHSQYVSLENYINKSESQRCIKIGISNKC